MNETTHLHIVGIGICTQGTDMEEKERATAAK